MIYSGEHKLNSVTLWQNFTGYIINVYLPTFIEFLCIYKPIYLFLKFKEFDVLNSLSSNRGDFK